RTHAYAPGAGGFDQVLALGEGHPQRLFGVDVLTGFDRAQAHLDMCTRYGEVDDDVDRGVGQQRLDRDRRHVELRALLFGDLGPHVRDGAYIEHIEARHRLEILRRNIAAPDDADAKATGHAVLPRLNRCGAARTGGVLWIGR